MKLSPAKFIWFDGKLVPWDEARVHVMAHALHYASAVFEGIRGYATPRGAAVLCLDAHVDRLFHSCKIVQLPLEHSKADLRGAILETVRKNALGACYIRPIVFRGYGSFGVWPEECPVETAIAAFPWIHPSEREQRENGIDVGVSSWRRPAPDTIPAMAKAAANYLSSQMILLEARRHGYAEGIGLDVDGFVAESGTQNLFVVHDGTITTAPAGDSILCGVTRRCVIQLAGDLSLRVVEQRVAREMLYTADEVFVTGTAAEITPVRSIDKSPVGDGKRGPVTQALQQRFFGILRGEHADTRGWLTPV